jgi:hypothetical protein
MSDAKTLRGYSDQEQIFDFSNADNEIVIANIGDYGQGNADETKVATLVRSWNPNAICTNGDDDYLADYSLSNQADYGVFVDRDIMFPCPGNHDWDAANLSLYLAYFDDVVDNQYYYAKQLGPVTLFMLDSDARTPDGNTPDSLQAEWFTEKAANCRTPWKVACIHRAPFSSDTSHGSTEDSQWDYSNMDLVLSGHAHTYERLLIGGTNYIVNGVGGSTNYLFSSTPLTGSQFRFNSKHGAAKMIITPKRLSWSFYSYDGALVDTLTLEK